MNQSKLSKLGMPCPYTELETLKSKLNEAEKALSEIVLCDKATDIYTIVVMKKLAEQALEKLRVKK